MESKEELIKSLIPPAVLIAKTKEAKFAIMDNFCKQNIIPIWHFPFRIGRESRYKPSEVGIQIFKRLLSDSKPNNDLYLLDLQEYFHISREHLLIDKKENHYTLNDRKSACGTTLNGKTFYDSTLTLQSGDTIQIGGVESPYLFEFVILEDEHRIMGHDMF